MTKPQHSPHSLYIHIPFCISKCRYCDFYSIPFDKNLADRYISCVPKELQLLKQAQELESLTIDTIFFGGGTPSLLTAEQWNTLTCLLKQQINLSENYEWSVECNPETFTDEKALVYVESGVTRLTFGVQSMNPRELALMKRVHTHQRVLDILSNPILKQFNSIGVDIIYGVPGQTMQSLKETIDTLLSFEIIKHISIYELTINPDTPFGRHLSLLPLPDEDLLYDMTQFIFETLRSRGFEHYEISNFARPGFRCRHNEIYWDHDPYIGLGCAAHSYLPPFRLANHNSILTYVQSLECGILPDRDSELIDYEAVAREMIFLGIRRADGIDSDRFNAATGFNFENYAGKEMLSLMIKEGLLYQEGSFWKPTERGMLTADGIARKLIHE